MPYHRYDAAETQSAARAMRLQAMAESCSAAVASGNIERARLLCQLAAESIYSSPHDSAPALSRRIEGIAAMFESHPGMLRDRKMREVFAKAVRVSLLKAAAIFQEETCIPVLEIVFPDPSALRVA